MKIPEISHSKKGCKLACIHKNTNHYAIVGFTGLFGLVLLIIMRNDWNDLNAHHLLLSYLNCCRR
jgi:hypothetical protein